MTGRNFEFCLWKIRPIVNRLNYTTGRNFLSCLRKIWPNVKRLNINGRNFIYCLGKIWPYVGGYFLYRRKRMNFQSLTFYIKILGSFNISSQIEFTLHFHLKKDRNLQYTFVSWATVRTDNLTCSHIPRQEYVNTDCKLFPELRADNLIHLFPKLGANTLTYSRTQTRINPDCNVDTCFRSWEHAVLCTHIRRQEMKPAVNLSWKRKRTFFFLKESWEWVFVYFQQAVSFPSIISKEKSLIFLASG